MAEGGISAAHAEAIARAVVAPVAAKVDHLEYVIERLDSRVSELEAEMGRVANAIEAMNAQLSRGLQEVSNQVATLNGVANEQLAAQNKTIERTDLVLGATTAGFAATTIATNSVGGKVERGTVAAAELEYLRQYNDARAPLQQIKEFSGEIVERFSAALESVAMNRMLYDEHFSRIELELDKKMRTVGEHIYRVVEQDFEPAVAKRVAIPRMAYHEAALTADVARTRSRSKELEADLGTTFVETVQPLLSMQADLEATLASRYAIDGAKPGTLALPFDVVCGGAPAWVACGSDLTLAEGSLAVQDDPRLAPVVGGLRQNADALAQSIELRDMDDTEHTQLVEALRSLAASGRIDPALLPGYEEALTERRLRVAKDDVDRAAARPAGA